MCGIAGLISRREEGESEVIVRKMMAAISHRGPDDEGVFTSDGVCLGHKRLSIIDVEHGQQPMISADGRHVLIFNGEIYNYIELRQQLIQRGARFRTFSDTEVLLQILIQEKEKGIEKLNGMFSFAFFDVNESWFLLCRDRVGIKPLYYSVKDDDLLFASEIKAILKSGLVQTAVNPDALQEYLTYQFCIGSKTMFDGIVKLEPGHYITGRKGKIEKIVKFWDTSFGVDSYHNEDYFEDQLLNLLYDSVKLQMRSDVPVGVYLSGGVDSSAIAVLAREISGNSLETFHGKFLEGPAYDESHYARLISDHTSSIYHETIPTLDDFITEFPKLIYALDEPVAGPGSFPQMLVSRKASERVKVILGGQGGDELFCGYARYLVGYLEQALKGSIFETQEEGKYLVSLQTIIKSLPLLKQYTPLMRNFWHKGLFEDMDARYFRLVDRSPDLDEILDPAMLASFNREKVFESFRTIFNHPDTKSYINKMTHFDLKTLLPSLLQVEDRMSMISSVESRVPLLDHRIIDLVTTMPPAIKFNEGQTKYIFKKTLRNKVPGEVINRKDKMGFPVPLNEWTKKKQFVDFVNDILGSQKARQRGIFAQDIQSQLLNKDTNYGRQLWGVLSLEMWHQTFMDNK
jgi:asparagine synthase (glutamine-hydrolysing)